MSTTLLIVQLIISIILTGLILIQRSEGGALGIGGGGGGGFMSGRAATNSIAKMTGILGTLFIINSLALTVVYGLESRDVDILNDTDEVEALTPGVEMPDTTLPLAEENPAADPSVVEPDSVPDDSSEPTDPDE